MTKLTKLNLSSLKDGRKYRMGMMCFAMLLATFGCCALNPVLAKLFAELVAGIIGIYIVYCGGNVTNKLVTKGSFSQQEQEEPEK